VTRAALIALALVACGARGRQASDVRRQEEGVRPQPDASPQSPGEQAMADVLQALRAQRDRMCACADAACVEAAEADQFEWGFTHKELVDRAQGTPDQNHEADTLIDETETCSHKLRP
jgi:hypothetical protein